jgi:hypothetical protein
LIKENILIQKRRKRKRIKSDGKTFYQEYNFEILILGLFTLGFFLLWEKWNIKSLVWSSITSIALFVITFLRNVSVRIGSLLSGVETSDLIGIILILIAIALVLNRTRLRIIERHPNLTSCPKCDAGLRRVHRKTKHIIQGFVFFCKIKRFKCRSCSFDGVAMIEGKK